MSTKHGWTTWDPSSIAVWEHLPSGLRCQLVLQDSEGHEVAPTSWEPLEEALPDDAGRSLAHIRLMVGDTEVDVECGGQGDIGACRITNVLGNNITAQWKVSGDLAGWQIRRGEFDVIFAPENAALPDDITEFIREQWTATRQSVPKGELRLAAPLEALEATIAANTFTLPSTGEIITLSRHELETTGEWRIHNWQSFLSALSIAYVDPALAIANFKTTLHHLVADGMLGAESTANGVRSDISNPPVAAYCLWKLYQLTGDSTILNDIYPLLVHWHDWWWNARDANQNQMLNWKSVDETGMPGHPLYESAPTDDAMGIMTIDDVGLCSLWALDAFALMRFAMLISDLDRATHLETEINEMATRINLYLWDRGQRIFRSRDWDGYFTDRQSATIFLALTGSVVTRGHDQDLIDHLKLDYGTPYMIPTVSKNDPAFGEQQPWRGRVSPLLSYLICEGLRQYGQDELAEDITLSCLDLISNSWQHNHCSYASYNAISGLGDDIPQDPLSPAGMLLSTLGIGMLIDAEPWNGIRMGNLHGVDMAIRDLPFRGKVYDLTSGPWGFSAVCDGDLWFDCDRPAIIRNLSQTGREISCGVKLEAGGPIRLRFHGYNPGDSVILKVNGNATPVTVDKMGIVDCVVDAQGKQGGHGIWHRAA